MSNNRFSNVSLDGKQDAVVDGTPNGATDYRPARRADSRTSGFIGRSISRRSTNATISTAAETITNIPDMKTILADAIAHNEIVMIPVDGEQYDIDVSSLVFCRRTNDVVAAVNLVFAATAADNLGEIYIEDNDGDRNDRRERNNINVTRTPADIWEGSDRYYNLVKGLVEDHPAFGKCEVHMVGQLVVQQGVDLSSTEAMHEVLFRCIDATEGYLADLGVDGMQRQEFSLATFTDQEEDLGVSIKMGGSDIIDELGNRVRSDIGVTLVKRPRYPDRKDGERTIKVTDLASASGWVEPCYVGIKDTKGMGANWGRDDTQVYTPTFVISRLDTIRDGVTLPQVLSMLVSVNILADKNRWIASFRPDFAHHYKYRHVGGLGKDIPQPGSPIDQNIKMGAQPATAEFASRYSNYIQYGFELNQLAIAIDVEQGGVNSPLLGLILDAAAGRSDAEKIVLDAAIEAFGDAFLDEYEAQGRPPLFVTDYTHIPLGTFVDENNEVRDIRNIDLCYLQNLDLNPDTIYDFNDALYEGEIDYYRRVSDLLRILRSVAPTFSHTGYARRVFVTDEFFAIAGVAMDASGVRLSPDNKFGIESDGRNGVRQQRSRGTRGHGSIFERHGRASSRRMDTRSRRR